jgi:hypothetical protein
MTVYGVWIINKAGGLIFQRNYGGKPSPLGTIPRDRPLTRDYHFSFIPVHTFRSSVRSPLGSAFAAGIAHLSSNEYLVMAGTLHGVHAITSRIAPVPRSSGVQIIESESFKMTIHMTLTGAFFSPFPRRRERLG